MIELWEQLFCCNALLGMTCDEHPKLLSAALSC